MSVGLGSLCLVAAARGAPEPPAPFWQVLGLASVPVLGFLAVAPVLWLFFGGTWRELDRVAHEHREVTLRAGRYDFRPIALFTITASVLLLQQYFGGGDFYGRQIRPWLVEQHQRAALEGAGWALSLDMKKWGELYGFLWWAITRVGGYTVMPMLLWKLLFPKDSVLDMGLRTRGMSKHFPLYALCLAVVVPAVFIVGKQPDFATYYPFYDQCQRSWLDLALWEILYVSQFFALEVFFRGFWLYGLRTTLGSGAVFAMIVPYCMIHFGKPYLEACGAVIAGIALGSLSMKTKSIYAGVVVHVTIALQMDLLSLAQSNRLPKTLFPPP